METSSLLIAIVAVAALAFYLGQQRSVALSRPAGGIPSLNSLPFYCGMLTAIWCALPALLVLAIWMGFEGTIIRHLVTQELPESQQQLKGPELGLIINSVENVANGLHGVDTPAYIERAAEHLRQMHKISQLAITGLSLCLAILFAGWAWLRISPELKARLKVEGAFKVALLFCACVAITTTVGIVLSVLFESLRFFHAVPITEFLFGLEWSPQIAIREGQVGGSGAFGAIPLFVGTLLISAIAMVVAVPAGLMAAIYLSEYADRRVRLIVKPLLEVLAGIPTVVYGFFAALTVAPFIRDNLSGFDIDVSSESALAAGFVMGIMIIPFVSSLSDDVINAVPQSLRDGSLGLGATKSETIKQVVIPAALPGIVGGVLLAVSRAIGETMIVVMAAGLAANLTANPLESVTTVTVQIVTLLVGDQEFDSPKTLAAFALGLMLFVVTLALNFFALHVVKKYREQYD